MCPPADWGSQFRRSNFLWLKHLSTKMSSKLSCIFS
ncbi:hypothetical protein E2320_002749 [Naja naja]|nr:hypothetical protein E2320_002749 [Naja naja]